MTPVTYILLAVIVAVVLIDLYLKRKNKLATSKEIEKVFDKENPEKKKWWKNKVIIIISSVVLGAVLIVLIPVISNEVFNINHFNPPIEETKKHFNPPVEETGCIDGGSCYFFINEINTIQNIKGIKVFDSNGNFLGKLKDGKREGNWKEYYNNNQLAIEGVFSNGLMNGYFKHYWPNGNLAHEGDYKKGAGENALKSNIPSSGREGIHIFYYKTGSIRASLSHNRGRYYGTAKIYWKNGVMKAEGQYRNNDLISSSLKEWDKTGKPN